MEDTKEGIKRKKNTISSNYTKTPKLQADNLIMKDL